MPTFLSPGFARQYLTDPLVDSKISTRRKLPSDQVARGFTLKERVPNPGEWAVTRVASRSITTGPISFPAAREPGSSAPVSSPRASQARSLASARASRIFASISGAFAIPARTRQIVGVEAMLPAGPCRPCWSARAWTSLIVTAPSAIATATSISTRPGSCPARRSRRLSVASLKAAVSPIRSASSASNTVPACDTTPVPSQVMTGTVLLVVGCTCEVPLLVGIFVHQQDKNPSNDRHFRASSVRVGPQAQPATATAGREAALTEVGQEGTRFSRRSAA